MSCPYHKAKIKKTARKVLKECAGGMSASIVRTGRNKKKMLKVIEAVTSDTEPVNRSSGMVQWMGQGTSKPRRWFKPGVQKG